MGRKKHALFYLSNHSDNICSVKFYDENNLMSSCNCGIVTLWDLMNKKSVRNYKVSNYSALYSCMFNEETFFVKTKEGSVKLWNLKYDKCVTKLDANNFTFAKPYSIHNKVVAPINHNGDIAVYDVNIRHNSLLSDSQESSFSIKDGRVTDAATITTDWNKLVLPFREIKKKLQNTEILIYGENSNAYRNMTKGNLNLCSEIIDIYPLPLLGETFILACYEPSLFCIYDFRNPNDLISSFMINVNENVLSYHVSNNNCVVSTNNNMIYTLTIDENQRAVLRKVAKCEYNMSNIVIRPDNKIFISITNNATINICDLDQVKIVDQISSYKYNYFSFLDFHILSGFFAAAEKGKISIWTNQASNFSPPTGE
ncbi:conserved Plasmodium protein, unknown function [Plasmodium ovale wallikeri]|uniref:Uncharacterized protein n=3 Tax=Plasmodium ovale TaxID=36330 RepID=A0A1C3KTL8_PLAOA|nr:conserved Plasmodium protein, unknown function [Plasmodium ovale wallikeri]SBT77510.1 conserved Plasmodium protein, unknown function [Plasmodium ovale]